MGFVKIVLICGFFFFKNNDILVKVLFVLVVVI